MALISRAETRPQRILFSESSPNLGGQELQLLQQMDELQQRGIAVQLLCRPTSRIAQVAAERSLPTIAIPFRNSVHPFSIRAIAGIIRSWRPDAIISHSGHDANNCAFAARLAAFGKVRQPRLIRVRTYQPGLPHAWTYNRLADLTLVPSEEIRRNLLANPRIKSERICVLYPGLTLDRLDREAELPLPAHIAAWLETHPGPLLVHAAMLRPEKGHAVLLEALARLIGKFPDLRCVLAGEGELRQTLETTVREQGLSEHVLLAGLVPNMAPLYRRADLVVMPSLVEPLGMSQSEALALGVPVVASRTGGIPETIEHQRTGLLVTPGDATAWVDSLYWALEHPAEMRSMASAGRCFVRENFSMPTNIERLLDFVGGPNSQTARTAC